MKVKKSDPKTHNLNNPIETKLLTYLWCNDGWCYIPELKKRQVYYADKHDLIIESSEWEGLIPNYEYCETIEMKVYSQSPLVWTEQSGDFYELYEEQITKKSKNK